jgi:D-arabinose 1-dehydrogenase-like Zn-dependent alcohol dehydrogenase
VHEFGAPLVLEDVARPEPGPGQVLVRVEAAGLCHTDIHAVRGEWPVKPKLPLIPGHEGVGVIEEVGRPRWRASRWATGSRCRGWATRAGSAATATTGGRRCARASCALVTPSTARTRTTCWATPATW